MPVQQLFPMIDPSGLAALEWLHVPVHIYSFTHDEICWANCAALEIWQADSLEDLQARQREPHGVTTKRRLAEYEEAFLRGETRTEVWTFYPKGQPTALQAYCRGVRLAGHERAMLVECSPVEPKLLSDSDLRALEAVRHAELMVSLFSRDGETLMRNPSAAACFYEHDAQHRPQRNLFRAMFANFKDADALLDRVDRDGYATGSYILALSGHPLHRIHVRRIDDPVTGVPTLLVLQEDVSINQIIHQKLEESEDAFLSILELTESAVMVVSAHTGAVMYGNTAAAALFEGTATSATPVTELFVSEAAYTEFRALLMARGGGTLDTMVKLRGDVLALASLAGSKVRYQGQDAIILTVGLKDQLLHESVQLRQALADQSRTTDILRQKFACAAHEFRTPLAIIDSTAQRLARMREPVSTEKLQYKAQKIRRNVQRALQLMEVTTQSGPTDEMPLRYAPALHDLGESLTKVIQAVQDSMLDLTIDCQLGPLPPIWIDQTLIEHLFENLIGNSCKYSDASPKVEIRSYVTASDIEITVRDWGIGIPVDEANTIFAPGSRASNVRSRPGSGLGLFIAARIMAVHGGRIELGEVTGPGTKFRLHFPRDFSGDSK